MKKPSADGHPRINLMLITASPEVAAEAEAAGVDRVFVDLEALGKKERQGHLDTVMSGHRLEDIAPVRRALKSSRLLVRVNPLHAGSREEAARAIDAGADLLMLPMFRSARELDSFCRLVGGRARVVGLLETPEAAEAVQEIARVAGLSEIHVGLNDLYLGLGLDFIFEPLANGLVDRLAEAIRAAGLPFGVGGVARIGEGQLPAELVLGEHLRLGSSCVILSRTFHRNARTLAELRRGTELAFEIAKLRGAERDLAQRTPTDVELDRCKVREIVRLIAQRNRERRPCRT